jgi:hypothetical protein
MSVLRLLYLSLRLIAGRRFWLMPLFVLAWPAFQAVRLAVPDWNEGPITPEDVQGAMLGLPLAVLGIALGVRIIAGDLDRRTLEIAYTVPGGAQRAWLAKLGASGVLLLGGEALLGVTTFVFFTGFPPSALYGALQSGAFYLVCAMALATLFKSEATGALVAGALLLLNGVITGFGEMQLRVSPFWNAGALEGHDPADVLAWSVQNRVGFLLAIPIITALAFGRAERRESMLGG